MSNQGYLFDDIEMFSHKKGKTTAEFYDYESFVKKFTDAAKTTDDCYTPPAVYEEVLRYVDSIYELKGKKIIRPFYPGGDYENCEYPDDGVVIDNPPFSIMSSIIQFYVNNSVPFFLFSHGMTCTNNAEICTVVVADAEITYQNKAVVKTNFVTNLLPADILLITAPTLHKNLERIQKTGEPHFAKNVYPENVLSVSDMHKLADAGENFVVKRSEAKIIRCLDGLPKKLFGKHLLISDPKAKELTAAKQRVKELGRREIVIELSERERDIIRGLNGGG